jgi:hypothetical protein
MKEKKPYKENNMKNILAENLLRFGVKNLSKSDIKKLQEQDPNGRKLPGAKVTAQAPEKKLQASFMRADKKTATWFANIKMDPKTKKWNLVDIRFSADGQDTAAPPLRIENNLVQAGNVRQLLTVTGIGDLVGFTGPGMSPLAALNNLLSQISKQTGVQYGVSQQLKTIITPPEMPNFYYTYKESTVPKGSYLKPGIKFGVKSNVDPDTNQVLNKYLYIGERFDPSLAIVIDESGKLRGSGTQSVGSVLNTLLTAKQQYLNVSPNDDYAKDNVLKSIKSLPYQSLL